MVKQISSKCVQRIIRRSQTVERLRACSGIICSSSQGKTFENETKIQASTSSNKEPSILHPLKADQNENISILSSKPQQRINSEAPSSYLTMKHETEKIAAINFNNSMAPKIIGLSTRSAIFEWARSNHSFSPATLASIICVRSLHTAINTPLEEDPSLIRQGKLNAMRNEIYCHGSLLAAVQTSHLFIDCKHFVDMPLKLDAEVTLKDWNKIINEAQNGQVNPAALNVFIQEHFEQPGGELEEIEPVDFQHEVKAFETIDDEAYRIWAKDLHKKWPTLCRRVSQKVQSNPQQYSLIPVPNPFIVPGGRFREMYYWDSYFTIKGLLASEMFSTVRGMIENMGHLIEMFGYVPNGNRVYYLNRSQPPLLTWCVDAYFQRTGDLEFVRRSMAWLEKEMEFFTRNRCIHKEDWKSHLFRYHVVAGGPRPESYREDVECAEHISDAPEKLRLWGDIMAAAESGRDFSARWFHNEGPQAGKMGSTRTSSILPIDLNSIICGNLKTFAHFYNLLGMPEAAAKSHEQFINMKEAIHQIFWNDEMGCWFDYDLVSKEHVTTYFDTNFFPMFSECVHEGFDPHKIGTYLEKSGVLTFPGGIPTSLIASGQQWDFPNAWAPTTWVVIQGLRKIGMNDLARIIAEKWIRKNYMMWLHSGGRMFEKYNVATQCNKSQGGGGEYELQEGFGWTNGVILDLLMTYGHDLRWEEPHPSASPDCLCCPPADEIIKTTTNSSQIPDPSVVLRPPSASQKA
jgi:alpha,alpha-trehalase